MCCANQLTGFYMRATLAANGLNIELNLQYNLYYTLNEKISTNSRTRPRFCKINIAAFWQIMSSNQSNQEGNSICFKAIKVTDFLNFF